MQKLIKPHKRQKELNLPIITSALILTLLAISPAAASVNNLDISSSPKIGYFPAQIYAKTLEEAGNFGVTLTLYENFEPFINLGQYIDILYMLGGIGAAILISFIYSRMIKGENGFIANFRKIFFSFKIQKIAGTDEEAAQEKIDVKKLRLYIAIPVMCIGIAELLIFSGRMKAAVCVHIGVLIALSLSNVFIKDPGVNKIYQALIFLPALRIVNLSMPIFFETTLYAFIFIYGPLAIPAAIVVIHQRNLFKDIGITTKHLLTYMVLSVPLGFLLALGEYMTIRPGYLIPDLTFGNLLKLTLIMIFFVGLVEELIFRAILQTRLEQALSLSEALLITSLLFGLMHSGYGTFNEILYTSFVGFLMGIIFYKTRSLPFLAIIHGIVNVFLFGILPYYLIGRTWF